MEFEFSLDCKYCKNTLNSKSAVYMCEYCTQNHDCIVADKKQLLKQKYNYTNNKDINDLYNLIYHFHPYYSFCANTSDCIGVLCPNCSKPVCKTHLSKHMASFSCTRKKKS